MRRDLREVFKKDAEVQKLSLSEGHEDRFLARLEQQLPKKVVTYHWYKVAAVVLVLLSLGYFTFQEFTQKDTIKVASTEDKEHDELPNRISLGDLSPDLKKVENYYVANINLALAKLDVSDEHKDLVNTYLKQLAELNSEYEKLNTELNEMGPNDQTITALIQNLQLRLQLLQKLKRKLNELNTSKNEQVETNTM